jgi:predicted phosphodiesterase
MALRQVRGRVDLPLGGHIHLAYSGVVEDVVVTHPGTASSNRLEGEPNSYNLIEADGERVTVLNRRWDGNRFGTHERAESPRTRREKS